MKIPQIFISEKKNLEEHTNKLLNKPEIVKQDPIKRDAWELLRGKLRCGEVEDYKSWLDGYNKTGKKPNVCFDRPMDKKDVMKLYVAVADFEITPLYGDRAIKIIIPKEVKFLGGKLGDTQLYFEDRFNTTGPVGAYKDI